MKAKGFMKEEKKIVVSSIGAAKCYKKVSTFRQNWEQTSVGPVIPSLEISMDV
tara:strand:+ start:611 stop:769 length:159 start_codon:yes stop_codon:yes gene_type:complete